MYDLETDLNFIYFLRGVLTLANSKIVIKCFTLNRSVTENIDNKNVEI